MLTDKRLLKCAQMVSGKGSVCDVGTDHAYLPVHLIQNNICSYAVAGDVADGPLEAATLTVEKSGLSDRISIVKSDGLKNIAPDGITDVIVAGMGAETISEIINNAPWLHDGINLILQPMTKVPFLRRWLYENGYEILREEAVTDEGHIYTVMNVRYSGYRIDVNNVFAELGMFDFTEESSVKYAEKQFNRIKRISDGMKKSDRDSDTDVLDEECRLISAVAEGKNKITVGMIYDEINRVAPFSSQDSWDNSGLLVGDRDNEVTGILTALDITKEVIDEAVSKNVNLIISHHPVIFHPLKRLSLNNPAVRLAVYGISAICVHTPLDKAVNGINDMIADMLERNFKVTGTRRPIIPEAKDSTSGDGRIIELADSVAPEVFAEKLKAMFGNSPLKFIPGRVSVKKVAVCSGSGGSLLSYVLKNGCDSYITGDVKHDVWLDAAENGISLFDCGHYYTEHISAGYLQKLLRTISLGINVEVSSYSRDIVKYLY
ncbi:MAG: Nif3-like dinuclear metal center hexameric protein [Oscillospiraceae bacterium]|nr:Nif3-like dinuclear metal center hexameric protein [Oscillospiraceae bacterium]